MIAWLLSSVSKVQLIVFFCGALIFASFMAIRPVAGLTDASGVQSEANRASNALNYASLNEPMERILATGFIRNNGPNNRFSAAGAETAAAGVAAAAAFEVPKILATVYDRGAWSAYLKQEEALQIVKAGDTLGAWTVDEISHSEIVLSSDATVQRIDVLQSSSKLDRKE